MALRMNSVKKEKVTNDLAASKPLWREDGLISIIKLRQLYLETGLRSTDHRKAFQSFKGQSKVSNARSSRLSQAAESADCIRSAQKNNHKKGVTVRSQVQ